MSIIYIAYRILQVFAIYFDLVIADRRGSEITPVLPISGQRTAIYQLETCTHSTK